MIVSKRNEDGTITITVNNGDVQGMDQVLSKWKLRDDAAILKIALGAMLNAKNEKLYVDVDDTGTTKGFIVVPDDLKAQPGKQSDDQANPGN